jgi:hypothetical protein
VGNGAVVSSVADPVFTLITKDGRCSAGLFDLFAGAIRGDIIDLPALAAHQRAPAVTVLSIFMHVLARYARVEGQSAASWADAWDKLISADALRLTAPDGKVAFLQPPTNEPTSPQSIEAADLMLPNVEHEVKRTWSTHSAETAIFSLMGSLARPNTKDHRSSTRTGICAVLPSADGTIGSEIVALVTAYDRLNLPSNKSTKAQDHFVWLKPYRPADKSMSFADLPLPFLDVGRAQRIVATTNGRFEIWACPNNTVRVTGRDPWLDDPHVPKITESKSVARYKLAAKPFDHRFQHHVLFGNIDKQRTIERPRILDLIDYRLVRLTALGTDQGKTKGYREALFVAARSDGLFHLDPPKPKDRPARLSAAALSTIEAGATILFSALSALYAETDDLTVTDRMHIRRCQEAYRARVGPATVQLIFDLLNQEENAPEEQHLLETLVADEVRAAFDVALSALVRPLDAARAEHRLEGGIRFKLKGEAMSKQSEPPLLSRRTFAIVQDISAHATPNDRARLRTMFLPDPPLTFWKLLASVPEEQTNNERCVEIWKIVLRALGDIRHGSNSLGRSLAEQEFPENRMERLLTASGSSLPGLIEEALRWLSSHHVQTVDLSIFASLGLADALGDAEARDWTRRQIALDYVRQARTEHRATKDAETSVEMKEAS